MGGRKLATGVLNITVKDGVDVNAQRYGDTKGSYFDGSDLPDTNTVLVNEGSRRYWTIMMDNLATGERHTFRFSYEMLIGRTTPKTANEVKLVLGKDTTVSGEHSKIYEMGNRLVIMDLGSRNSTYLNGMKVYQPMEIPMWGQIRIGQNSFRVVYMAKQ